MLVTNLMVRGVLEYGDGVESNEGTIKWFVASCDAIDGAEGYQHQNGLSSAVAGRELDPERLEPTRRDQKWWVNNGLQGTCDTVHDKAEVKTAADDKLSGGTAECEMAAFDKAYLKKAASGKVAGRKVPKSKVAGYNETNKKMQTARKQEIGRRRQHEGKVWIPG